jgi:hypothetical protein
MYIIYYLLSGLVLADLHFVFLLPPGYGEPNQDEWQACPDKQQADHQERAGTTTLRQDRRLLRSGRNLGHRRRTTAALLGGAFGIPAHTFYAH